MDPLDKLAAARTRLILDRPFLGALVLRLPLVEASPKWCRSVATDARSLYFNAQYVDRLSVAQTEFVLAHEALHCALQHFARRGHRVQRKWDLACDLAVNPLLVDEGLRPPPEAIVLDVYRGMAAEEIYPCLEDDRDEETLDQHLFDGDAGGRGESADSGDSRGGGGGGGENSESASGMSRQGEDGAHSPPKAPDPAERERLAHEWQQHLASAAQRAHAAGKLAGNMARLVEAWLAPQLPWRSLLAHYLFSSARTDYSYMRPSRREGAMILPSLRGTHCEALVALDTSGSIGEAELEQFVGEVNAIKGSLPVRITLLACDSALAPEAPWVYEAWEELRLPPRIAGGGGTNFVPVFDWAEREGLRPDVLLYFTDAQGEFPPAAPAFPVLWLVKGHAAVPWGTRIQLN